MAQHKIGRRIDAPRQFAAVGRPVAVDDGNRHIAQASLVRAADKSTA
jgi:hypothetical protein